MLPEPKQPRSMIVQAARRQARASVFRIGDAANAWSARCPGRWAKAEKFSVVAAPVYLGKTTGEVQVDRVTNHGTSPVLCTAKLTSAAGSCTLPAGKLAVGGYSIAAVYTGDSNYSPSISTHQTLQVTS